MTISVETRIWDQAWDDNFVLVRANGVLSIETQDGTIEISSREADAIVDINHLILLLDRARQEYQIAKTQEAA